MLRETTFRYAWIQHYKIFNKNEKNARLRHTLSSWYDHAGIATQAKVEINDKV